MRPLMSFKGCPRAALLFLLGLSVFVGACDNNPPRTSATQDKTIALREHDPALNEDDPCVKNLDRIVEALMLYYSAYHKLPATLADARPLSAIDGQRPFSLQCPRSQHNYVYHIPALAAPEAVIPTHMRLLLNDDEAAHPIRQTLSDGKDQYDYLRTVRYGIVRAPITQGQPLQMFVVPLDDNLMKVYSHN